MDDLLHILIHPLLRRLAYQLLEGNTEGAVAAQQQVGTSDKGQRGYAGKNNMEQEFLIGMYFVHKRNICFCAAKIKKSLTHREEAFIVNFWPHDEVNF